MKKHIDDLRNVLYIHDLTVALEEDIPAFPATWTLPHPYFTLPMTIAFYSGLTLNQYGVALPCRTICTVCGFVALS